MVYTCLQCGYNNADTTVEENQIEAYGETLGWTCTECGNDHRFRNVPTDTLQRIADDMKDGLGKDKTKTELLIAVLDEHPVLTRVEAERTADYIKDGQEIDKMREELP